MTQPDSVCVQVLPCPVQAGQFAEIPVPVTDVFSAVIPCVGQRRVQSAPRLHRQVQRVIRHAVFSVRGNNNLNLHVRPLINGLKKVYDCSMDCVNLNFPVFSR